MAGYLDNRYVGFLNDPAAVDRADRIEDSELGDEVVVTGAILKGVFNPLVAALDPLQAHRPHRAALAFLIEIDFIKGAVGGEKPSAGEVPAGYVFMDTANSDEVTWSDGATWRTLDEDERLIDKALIGLRNQVSSKIDDSELDQLRDGASAGGDTLRKLELLIQALQAGLSAKLDTGAFQTELSTKVLAASQLTSGVIDPARIPASVRAAPIVSAGGFAELTSLQIGQIGQGSAVVLSSGADAGVVFFYSGGDKTLEASYVRGADTTPDASQIAGLSTLLAAKADSSPALSRPLPNYGLDGSGLPADSNPATRPGGAYPHGDNVHPYSAVVLS